MTAAMATVHDRCYSFSMPDEPTQLDRFKQAARDLECDDDEERFNERMRALVKHKPVKKPVPLTE